MEKRVISVIRAIHVEFFIENLADVTSLMDLKIVSSEINGNNTLGNSGCNSQENEVWSRILYLDILIS